MSTDALRRIERFAALAVRERAERYFAQRRVEVRSIDDGHIRATVSGSERYSVLLRWRTDEVDAACTCDHFDRDEVICKHIWATLLAAAERNPSMLRDVTRLSPSLDILGELDDEDEPLPPPVRIDAHRSLRDPRVAFAPPPRWRVFLQSVEHRLQYEPEPTSVSELPAQIMYVIDPTTGSSHLPTFGRYVKKNGELGNPRRIRLTEALIEKLPDEERDLASLMFEAYEVPLLRAPRIHAILPRLTASERLYFLESAGVFRGPLQHDERLWNFEVVVERKSDSYRVTGRFVHHEEVTALRSIDRFFAGGWFLRGLMMGRYETRGASAWVEALNTQDEVSLPLEAQGEIASVLASSPRTRIVAPPEFQLVEVAPSPKLVMERERGESWQGELRVVYGEREIDPSVSRTTQLDGQYIRRRPDLERSFTELLETLGFRSWSGSTYHIIDKQLGPALARLIEDDWSIELEGQILHTEGELTLEVTSGIDWFDLQGGVEFANGTVALPRLLDSISKNESLIRLDDGGVALIDREWVERLRDVAVSRTAGEGSIRFSRSQITLVDALFAAQRNVTFDRDFQALRARLQKSAAIEPHQEPPGFGTVLRPYQRVGLGWLHFLREVGFGGCLADDMGLGKTVQALALLEEIRIEQGGSLKRPSLVIAPKSLMFNWKAEAARFTPNLRVIGHHGIDRVKSSEHLAEFDLILTTYATLQRDLIHLASLDFEYVILDEAQSIRNPGSQSAKAVKALRARNRLALSGTPIENHLGDLWSIFDFLNPGMLGSARTFSRTYGAKNATPEMRERLARVVAPFVLRRTKSMVLSDLPEKDEQTLWVELSEKERRDYDELREHYRALLLDRVKSEGLEKSKIYVLEALLRLRQAALHPGLLHERQKSGTSAKLDALEAELAILVDSGHKALVFSQFVGLLDIVQERVDAMGILSLRLDGRTRDRQAVVRRFQEDETVSVMLVSLKAGGVGLNLTAADYVYLLDPWWNPAAEAQAVDRAHRIGQERKVTAVRIVASDTVEEKILELQQQKRELAASIIQADEGVLRTLDLSDLEMLLS